MDRRGFLASAAGAGVIAATGTSSGTSQPARARSSGSFGMHFAPHFGMFKSLGGDDLVAQLEFAASEGFTAWEDNGMSGRSSSDQKRIARAMNDLGMMMGVFVLNPSTAWGPTFSRGNASDRQKFLDETKAAVDVAKTVNAKWMTVVPGKRENRLDEGYMTAHAIDQLRAAAEILEPEGLVMVLEPLNPRNHPDMLLAKMAHAFAICRGVDSPSCKILCDLYHQQITEGNLLPNVDRCWDEIAYFQIGDNPGRKEPTTGEINYANVFAHIKQRGFRGVLGMEHGNSKSGADGERAVIEAYRACDPA
ncbi:MAG: TIM barrel protein [Planctomycetota bacterium]